jgi:glutamate formiminotransferase/formiminotetrahydrofolate cyclodeaminase
MIDADTGAYNEYMDGLRMPQNTRAEKAARREKMQEGLKAATRVPLNIMRLAERAWDPLCELARYGNPATKSDVQVGAKALETGIWGACQNVRINVTDIQDTDFKSATVTEAEMMAERASRKCREILNILEQR